MASLGSLIVFLEANIARYQSDMERAVQGTESAMRRVKSAASVVTGALAVVGVALTVDALIGSSTLIRRTGRLLGTV